MNGAALFRPAPRRALRSAARLALALGLAAAACAQEPEPTERQRAIERARAAIEREPALSAETRDALRDLLDALEQEPGRETVAGERLARAVDDHLRANPPVAAPRPWESALERLEVYGDLRLRHESDLERDDRDDRHRERVRLRLGVGYRVSDELTLGARVVTGNAGDPNSPHATLGDVFGGLEIGLDRAFVSFEPGWARGLTLLAGKFDQPIARNPVYPELVWDADVQPEGVLGRYSFATPEPLESLAVLAAAYPVLERDDGADAFASVLEASARVRLGERITSAASVAFQHLTDPTPDGSAAILADNAGNATVDRDGDGEPDDFASGFGVLHPIVSLVYEGWDSPLAIAAEYVENLRADVAKARGWAFGAALGSTRRAGDWRVYYQWQVIEQDAVFSAFAQDDFLFQTNHRSHVFGARYQILDDVGIHVWGLFSSPDRTFAVPTADSDAFQYRVRVDLDVKL